MNPTELSKLFEGFRWWTPIPWLIGLCSLIIAIYVLRRTRFAAVRLYYVSAAVIQSPPNFDDIIHLIVDVICKGADIHDPSLWLECYYGKSRHRSHWPDVLALYFSPKPPAPNPIKNGQVMRFQLVDTHIRRALELNNGYYSIPSALSSRRVHLVLYSSGDRVVARFPKRLFRRELRLFDSLCSQHVRSGQERFGWSHQYVQDENTENA